MAAPFTGILCGVEGDPASTPLLVSNRSLLLSGEHRRGDEGALLAVVFDEVA